MGIVHSVPTGSPLQLDPATGLAEVRLSWPELRRALLVGGERYVRSLSKGRRPRYGADREMWHADILGAWGECVIAKATGSYWPLDDLEPDRGPDVGRLHVRTASDLRHSLILHPGDLDAEAYVLVVPAALPRFYVVGWIRGADGKRPEWWRGDLERPAFFVPRTALNPWPVDETPIGDDDDGDD